MKCPKCQDAILAEVQVGPGLAVDLCRSCSGAWLDKSELYRFVRRPQRLYEELASAFRSVSPSNFSCPRCGKMMLHSRLDSADVVLEACPGCGGTWFDKGEVEKIQAAIARPDGAASAPTAPARQGSSPEPDGGPGPAGRPLTEMEVATVFGSDIFAALAFVTAAGAAGAASLGLLLGGMGKLPIGVADAGLLVITALPAAGLFFFIGRRRGLRRREARLFRGAVTGVRNLAAGPWGEIELKVRFVHAGSEHEVTRRVGYRVFSDAVEGASVGVVVPTEGPAAARIIRDV
ncbi:MAG: zf-TFIIB domain-containing protein [Elusimicrobiota bacterium]|jgi:Zn-finger nucleic acid-binding protein